MTVSDWIAAIGFYAVALPGTLLLIGWETPALTQLFSLAFLAIVLHVQWFAARMTLGIHTGLAAAITRFGCVLSAGAHSAVQLLCELQVG